MTLRDLFDSDSRSKQQLRDEIQSLNLLLEQGATELEKQRSAQEVLTQLLTGRDGEVSTQKTEIERVVAELAAARKDITNLEAHVKNQASSLVAINAGHQSIELRESTLYKNFAELQRREDVLAKDLEKLTLRERAIGADSRQALEAKTREIEILRTDLHAAEREVREAKFLYDAMFQPYKEKAIREGRPVVDVQVADLQSKLFEAYEKLRELTETGAPELRKAKQEVSELRLQLERQREDIRTHDRQVHLLQRRVNEAEDKVVEAERGVDLARTRTQAELSKLTLASTARSESLQEKERELSGLKRSVQSAQNKVVTLGAFHKTMIQEKEREISRLEDELKVARVSRTTTGKTLEFPDKWTNHRVLAWMLAKANPEDCDVESGYLALLGTGPWKRSEFDKLLKSKEFSLWPLPDAEVRHLVVGKEGWTPEELEMQIEAVEGESLRIYSQEMWFAYLATGRDPFDSGDEELLLAFAEGHPALQYLIGRADLPWPEVSVGGGDIVRPPIGDFGVLESPMHMLDYRVGATSPHDEDSRREILSICFNAMKLPFGDDCSKSYRAGWGGAKSAQRLYRMALHIKHQIDGPSGRDYRKPQATADWLSDLKWLKETYFKKPLRKFEWPASSL